MNFFVELMGDSPEVRMLDLMLRNPQTKFNKSMISRNAKISRTTLQGVCSKFKKMGIIQKTGYYYKLRLYREELQQLKELYDALKEGL